MFTVQGLGFGTFLSLDFALAVDVLPSQKNAARDLGIWVRLIVHDFSDLISQHMSLVLPMLLATPVAGFLLDALEGWCAAPSHLGYDVLFEIGCVMFSAGGFFLCCLRDVR